MYGPRRIGILGGMGPEATILLQRKVLKAVTAHDDRDHIPLLIDMNPQVPSRIAHLMEGAREDPGPILAAMAAGLQEAGCAALAMPCNTAHHYADAIRQSVEIPFLDMIDIASAHAVHTVGEAGRVGVLGSPALKYAGVLDRALGAKGMSVIWPEHDDTMLAAIRMIKSQGPTEAARATLLAASTALADAGADLQFVACSEFSLIAQSVHPGANAIDTIDLLAQAIVDFSTTTSPAAS